MKKCYFSLLVVFFAGGECIRHADEEIDDASIFIYKPALNEKFPNGTAKIEKNANMKYPSFSTNDAVESGPPLKSEPKTRILDHKVAAPKNQELKYVQEAHPYRSNLKQKKSHFPFFRHKKASDINQDKRKRKNNFICFNCRKNEDGKEKKLPLDIPTPSSFVALPSQKKSQVEPEVLQQEIRELLNSKRKNQLSLSEIESLHNYNQRMFHTKLESKRPVVSTNEYSQNVNKFNGLESGGHSDENFDNKENDSYNIKNKETKQSDVQKPATDPRSEERLRELEEVQRKISMMNMKKPIQKSLSRFKEDQNLFFPPDYY